MISIIASSAPGLSPLTRGTPDYLLFQSSHRRFIPAGAGNTIVFAPVSLSRSVYPRWRGEHVTVGVTLNCWNGLSPLARGTRSSTVSSGASSPVYPRWRGEHFFCRIQPYFFAGLSPLARGTQKSKCLQKKRRRFIPAGAGNTRPCNRNGDFNSVYPRWRGEHGFTSLNDFKFCGLSPLARGTRHALTDH